METLPAGKAKNSFERLINFPRFAPSQMEKRGPPLIVVMTVEDEEIALLILPEAKTARLIPSCENTR